MMISHNVKNSDDLFVYEYDISNELNFEELRTACLEYKQSHPNHKHKKLHNAFMSGFNLHRETDKFKTLIQLIEQKTQEHIDPVVKDIGIKAKFVVQESWIVMYNKFGFVENHGHFPFGYSAVCYITANNTSNIQFHDIELTPKQGMLLLFPGGLSHKVKPVTIHHGERITFACNLYPNFEYTNFEKLNKHFNVK